MFHAIQTGNDSFTVTITNETARELRALSSDCRTTLEIAHDVSYKPTPTPQRQLTESERFYARRARECALVRKLYTKNLVTAYQQLCVFGKTNTLDKRLLAVVCYTVRGTAWLDIDYECNVTRIRKLGDVKVSQRLARELLNAPNDVRVYLQDFTEVLKEHNNRMNDNRRKHDHGKYAPKLRRVGKYNQKPLGRIDNDRVFESVPDVTYEPAWIPDPPVKSR